MTNKNGRLQGFLARADHLSRLESIHLRHANIQQNRGEIVLQTQAQRVGSGLGEHQVLPERFEDCLEGQKIVRVVVDEQELDPSVFLWRRLWPPCSALSAPAWLSCEPYAG